MHMHTRQSLAGSSQGSAAMGPLPGSTVLRALLRAMRPPFLLLSVVAVLLGAAATRHAGLDFDASILLLVLLGALAAHASVNLFNEYHDAISGLDARTRRTPFSGGSGALQQWPQAIVAVRRAAWATLLLTLLVGLGLFALRGWPLLLPGLLGVLLVLAYTPWLNRSALLCLIAPGLGFGPLMVIGSALALTGSAPATALWAAMLLFYLASNLLLLNQFPDLEADRRAGRRHLPIRYGLVAAGRVYLAFALAAAAVLPAGILTGLFPLSALWALLPWLACLHAWRGAVRHGSALADHPGHLASNVLATLLTPAVLAAVLW